MEIAFAFLGGPGRIANTRPLGLVSELAVNKRNASGKDGTSVCAVNAGWDAYASCECAESLSLAGD